MLPAYNEQEAITPLLKKIIATSKKEEMEFEIVVVDDGSGDHTPNLVRYLARVNSVTLLQHPVNRGLAAAMQTGFNHILEKGKSGDIIVTMDADDTQPPATIPKMIGKILEGYDVVIASRYQSGSRTIGVPANRRLMTWFAKWLFKLFTPIPGVWDYTCGFRAYRFDILQTADDYYGVEFISENGFSSMVDILLKMRRFESVMGEVPFLLRYDQKAGPSKMNVSSTAIQTFKLLVKRRFGW